MTEKILKVPMRILNTKSPNWTIPRFNRSPGKGIVRRNNLQVERERARHGYCVATKHWMISVMVRTESQQAVVADR